MHAPDNLEAPASSAGKLEVAVDQAVKDSLLVVDEHKSRIDCALSALEEVSTRARPSTRSDENANEIIDEFKEKILSIREDAAGLFLRQREVLGTVNIALFGRTGAGKSSLIEALIQGDGNTISTGESDYTTEVRAVECHACRFYDTPGTNGWGRSMSREVLEARARDAVEVADIVVLCFDNQSQQKREFEQIGAWVREYGKPVVAVLNVRNPLWRRPRSVQLGTQRRNISRSVREHVAHIETKLAALGIYSAPVVAISAQRALYGRVSGEYRGPNQSQFTKLVDEIGQMGLTRESNFEILENIFVDALIYHLNDLRFGMLHRQVKALLEGLANAMRGTNEEARTAAGILDTTIGGLLTIVGYPAKGSESRNTLNVAEHCEDLLTWVERLRGGAYDAEAQGKLGRFTRQRLEAEIDILRARSLAAAEEAIAHAFGERCDLDGHQLTEMIFDPAAVQATCERVIEESVEFLRRETQLKIDDARRDFEFAVGSGVCAEGSAGKFQRSFGYASSIGGTLAGVASICFMAFGVVPVAGPVIAGLGAAGLGWFGSKQRKQAERARQAAWADAVAQTRRDVNEVYDGLVRQVSDNVTALGRDATLKLLRDPLSRAAALWALVAESDEACRRIDRLGDELPAISDPQIAIMNAASAVSARYSDGGERNAALLGENWISDPDGLKADEGSADRSRTGAYDPGLFRQLFEGFRNFVDGFGQTIDPGAGSSWLQEAEKSLAEDPSATQVIADLKGIAERGRARVQLFGDYNAGKTSFVKRLLIDAGLEVPWSIEVRAEPTTDRVHVYEWEQVDLIDTPRLQYAKESHDRLAMESYPDASVIICLMQPNLLTGDTRGIERVLRGDRLAGLVPKLDSTIFVIHRSDELGADPETAQEEHIRLCERKKKELQQALKSRDICVSSDRIFCMSADPYQLVGNRRDVRSEQFDAFRSWDGFAEFHACIRRLNARYAGVGMDRSILEGGLARLGTLDANARLGLDDIERRLAAMERVGAVLSDALAESERIEGDIRAKIRRMVEDHAFGQLERVLCASTQAELEASAKQLAEWWTQTSFHDEIERWGLDAKATIDDWFFRSIDDLERTMDTPRFKAAFAGADNTLDLSAFGSEEHNLFGKVMKLVGEPLKGTTRDFVDKIGKSLGVKFPEKTARVLQRVGVAAQLLTTIMDARAIYRDWKRERQRAESRKELGEFVNKTTRQILDSLTIENAEEGGPIAYMIASRNNLGLAMEDLSNARAALEAEASVLASRRQVYALRMEAAWTALGNKESTA